MTDRVIDFFGTAADGVPSLGLFYELNFCIIMINTVR